MRFWRSMHRPKPAQADVNYARYEAYSKLLDRNGRWIEVADTKAGIVLGFLVATFPVLMGPAFPAAQLLMRAAPAQGSVWAYLPGVALVTLMIAFVVAALYTFGHVFLTLMPRLRRQWDTGLVFFGDIAARKYGEWQQQMSALDPEALASEMLEQVYVTALIAERKHQAVQRAILGILTVVVLGLALYVISYLAV